MGANDPIYLANTPHSDATVAAVTKLYGLMLADRSAGSILANPTIGACFEGWQALGGLATRKIAVGFGMDKMATYTEGNAATILTLDSDYSTLTTAQRGFARRMSDRARLFDGWGMLDWMNFIRDCEWSFNQSIVDLFAALATSISATGGATGANDTWDLVYADANTLAQAKATGPYVMISSEKQWGKLAINALAKGGAVAMDPETLRYMSAIGYGYKGTFLHGNLDIYTSAELDTDGGDTLGMMFGREFLRWSAVAKPKSPAALEIARTPLWALEIQREGLYSDDITIGSTEAGAAIHINGAGIKRKLLT